jgi:hypothetical protein
MDDGSFLCFQLRFRTDVDHDGERGRADRQEVDFPIMEAKLTGRKKVLMSKAGEKYRLHFVTADLGYWEVDLSIL